MKIDVAGAIAELAQVQIPPLVRIQQRVIDDLALPSVRLSVARDLPRGAEQAAMLENNEAAIHLVVRQSIAFCLLVREVGTKSKTANAKALFLLGHRDGVGAFNGEKLAGIVVDRSGHDSLSVLTERGVVTIREEVFEVGAGVDEELNQSPAVTAKSQDLARKLSELAEYLSGLEADTTLAGPTLEIGSRDVNLRWKDSGGNPHQMSAIPG